jgi:nitrous oxide reductase accessory protein NosL
MKKLIATIVSVSLMSLYIAGCGKSDDNIETPAPKAAAEKSKSKAKGEGGGGMIPDFDVDGK